MLWVVMLGGKHPRAKIEVHDVAFVRADSLKESYPQLRQDWFGSQAGLHIDAWMQVDGVEHWKVGFSDLAPAPGSPRLFFINLGGYETGAYGEAHRYLLVVAENREQAKTKAKRQIPREWEKPHTDALLDVDDCLPIDQVGGRYVELLEAPHQGIVQRNDYIVLA